MINVIRAVYYFCKKRMLVILSVACFSTVVFLEDYAIDRIMFTIFTSIAIGVFINKVYKIVSLVFFKNGAEKKLSGFINVNVIIILLIPIIYMTFYISDLKRIRYEQDKILSYLLDCDKSNCNNGRLKIGDNITIEKMADNILKINSGISTHYVVYSIINGHCVEVRESEEFAINADLYCF